MASQDQQDQQEQQAQDPNNFANATHPPPSGTLGSTSAGQFQCQWTGCGENLSSPDTLYEHLCEKHIGRKSTNNLCLTCSWGSCRTQVVKRDHITSHVRVHVPLKPHRCSLCGKNFKRPQDLKKHVKTHADESVLNGGGPATANANQNHQQNGGYQQNPGYPNYPQGPGQPPMGFVPPMHNGPGYYHQQPAHNPHSYSVYYNHDASVGNQASYEHAKQDIGPLNSLFGDYRQSAFDPKSYQQVHNRLANIQSSGLSILSEGGMNEYRSLAAPSPVGESHGAIYGVMPHHILPRPIPNLRTKADLLSAEQLIDQMVTTVYENSDQMAAAGIGQPGAVPVQGNGGMRTSHSPTTPYMASSHYNGASGGRSPGQTRDNTSSHGSPPALTPPSSAMSYTSGRSPTSHHAEPQHASAPTASMYPSLPSAGLNGFSGAAASAGTNFDSAEQRRRYDAGLHQKAVPISPRFKNPDEMDTTEDAIATPKATGDHKSPKSAASDIETSMIDPALSGTAPKTAQSAAEAEEMAQKAEKTQAWVQNIRTIETLRYWLDFRLKHGDYEDGDQEPKQEAGEEEETIDESHSLYPVIKEVQATA